MLYIVDTANVEKIRHCIEFFPIAGVTTNPTIISKEHTDFLGLIRGLKATMALHAAGYHVTETAIFTQQQALMAAMAGADFVAPYVNRLDNIISDGVNVVAEIVELFTQYKLSTRVLAASFKTAEQVHKISLVGGHAVTVNPDILETLVYHPLTMYAIDDFKADWESVYGKKTILDMIKG